MRFIFSPVFVWLLTAILLVATALSIVLIRFENRSLFARLQKTQQAHDVMRLESVNLVTELSMFSANGRIDRLAKEKLLMRPPKTEAVVYIK